MASTLDYLVPELRIQDPCGHETTRSASQRKGFRQGPRRLRPPLCLARRQLPPSKGKDQKGCPAPISTGQRALGNCESGNESPSGLEWTLQVSGQTGKPRDVTRSTRHITLQLEHLLALNRSTPHRASQQVLHQWRPRLDGDRCREGIVDTHEKKSGALGNRRSNGPPASSPSVLTLAPCCFADTES